MAAAGLITLVFCNYCRRHAGFVGPDDDDSSIPALDSGPRRRKFEIMNGDWGTLSIGPRNFEHGKNC